MLILQTCSGARAWLRHRATIDAQSPFAEIATGSSTRPARLENRGGSERVTLSEGSRASILSHHRRRKKRCGERDRWRSW